MDYACNWRGGGRGGCRRLAERWRGAPALGCDRSSAAIARGAGRTAASPCRALPRLGRVAALGSLIPRRGFPGRGDRDGGGSPPDVCEGAAGGAGDIARQGVGIRSPGSAIWPGPTVGSVPGCPVPARARTYRGRVAPAGALRYCSGAPACGAFRRGGRAVEGARLESVYGGNSIAGSNPAPSVPDLSTDNCRTPKSSRNPGFTSYLLSTILEASTAAIHVSPSGRTMDRRVSTTAGI